MPDHRDKPASVMAYGLVKGDDVERVRRDVDEADAHAVRGEEIAVARHRQRVADRDAADADDAQT